MEVSRFFNRLRPRIDRKEDHSIAESRDFGPLGLSLVHDISGSMSALLLDIERLRLDAGAIEQSIRTAQQQILGLGEGMIRIRYELRAALEEFSARCEEKNIQLSLYAPQDFDVQGSPAKFRIVMSNLLRNAIDAVAGMENARIQLYLRASNTKVIVEVVDNGRGISSAQAEKIFARGYSATRGKGHMGLGLSLVRHIVERDLNGTVAVHSNNRTTIFSLTFQFNRDDSQTLSLKA